MQTQIKADGFEMDGAINSYLEERIVAISRHMGDDSDEIRFEIELGRSASHQKNGSPWKAELQIRVPGGDYTRVVGTGESVYAAIDEMKDDAMRKLRTRKKSKTHFLRQSGAALKKMLRFE